MKARQCYLAAETIAAVIDEADVSDAYVTLCVHAGIAAADVICCAKLGAHTTGQRHADAVALLATADRALARHLNTLLTMKTRSGYSPTLASVPDQRRAGRAAAAMLLAAEAV